MALPQTGIFALGNLAHTYLEFELRDPAAVAALVTAVADLSEPRTTMGGVNLVTGFRPELWSAVAPSRAPRDIHGFLEPVLGVEGFTMPATQRDLLLWIAGGSYDVVFDAAAAMTATLGGLAILVEEIVSWSYHRDLDLTGFIDGTENPSLLVAPQQVLVPQGSPGAGGSVLLLQKWIHDAAAWSALSREQQERVIGRTKPDSVELAARPVSSHVARTDQDEFGHIFRRNTPYGRLGENGTVFVGFSSEQAPPGQHARQHGRPARCPRRSDALLQAAHRCVLLRSLRRRRLGVRDLSPLTERTPARPAPPPCRRCGGWSASATGSRTTHWQPTG